jgi:hypothetical protein
MSYKSISNIEEKLTGRSSYSAKQSHEEALVPSRITDYPVVSQYSGHGTMVKTTIMVTKIYHVKSQNLEPKIH